MTKHSSKLQKLFFKSRIILFFRSQVGGRWFSGLESSDAKAHSNKLHKQLGPCSFPSFRTKFSLVLVFFLETKPKETTLGHHKSKLTSSLKQKSHALFFEAFSKTPSRSKKYYVLLKRVFIKTHKHIPGLFIDALLLRQTGSPVLKARQSQFSSLLVLASRSQLGTHQHCW